MPVLEISGTLRRQNKIQHSIPRYLIMFFYLLSFWCEIKIIFSCILCFWRLSISSALLFKLTIERFFTVPERDQFVNDDQTRFPLLNSIYLIPHASKNTWIHPSLLWKPSHRQLGHFNFRAGSTFPVPVCTVPHGHWVNKADNQQD